MFDDSLDGEGTDEASCFGGASCFVDNKTLFRSVVGCWDMSLVSRPLVTGRGTQEDGAGLNPSALTPPDEHLN